MEIEVKISDAIIEISIEDLLGADLNYLTEVRDAFAGKSPPETGFGIGPLKTMVTHVGMFHTAIRFFHSALWIRFSSLTAEPQQVIIQSILKLMSDHKKMHVRIRIGWTNGRTRCIKVEAFSTNQGFYGEGLAFRLAGS